MQYVNFTFRKTCSGLQSLLLNDNHSDDTITCSANIPPIEEDHEEPEKKNSQTTEATNTCQTDEKLLDLE